MIQRRDVDITFDLEIDKINKMASSVERRDRIGNFLEDVEEAVEAGDITDEMGRETIRRLYRVIAGS